MRKLTSGGGSNPRRETLGVSLRELARRTDLTAAFLSQVERGQANPSIGSLRRIAEALDEKVYYFLSEDDPLEGAAAPAGGASRSPRPPQLRGFGGRV